MRPSLTISAFFILLHIIAVGQTGQFQAKRTAPKEVPNICYENIILRRSGMEFVQALDSATKRVIWKKKIYNVTYTTGLETDVQDIFIDSMYLSGKQLIIRNEKKEWFSLDLQMLETKKIKPSSK